MYLLALIVVVLAILIIPVGKFPVGGQSLYERSFYWAGWNKNYTWVEKDPTTGQEVTKFNSGKHTFTGDVSCIFHRIADGDAGKIRNLCFAQGPRPEGAKELGVPNLENIQQTAVPIQRTVESVR